MKLFKGIKNKPMYAIGVIMELFGFAFIFAKVRTLDMLAGFGTIMAISFGLFLIFAGWFVAVKGGRNK